MAGSSPACTMRYTVIFDTRMIEATSATVRNRTSASCRSLDMITSIFYTRASPASPPADQYARARRTVGADVTRGEVNGKTLSRCPVDTPQHLRPSLTLSALLSVEPGVQAVVAEDGLTGRHDGPVDLAVRVVAHVPGLVPDRPVSRVEVTHAAGPLAAEQLAH